jgi:leader peptidase (prepilin peptidase) / N-methyltransferase
MTRVLGTVFAALMGLAFGSFLNVCLTRWPAGESIVKPRSHCRSCSRPLAWWENLPLVSWLALRGRCRTCGTWIGWRYVLVETTVGALWAYTAWRSLPRILYPFKSEIYPHEHIVSALLLLALYWLLVALAALDAEHFWVPDRITIPATVFLSLPELVPLAGIWISNRSDRDISLDVAWAMAKYLLGIVAAAGLILLIRWIYKLLRHREGLGLGDAKLMAMLAAWLGLSGALLSFAIGVVLGSLAAIVLLVRRTKPSSAETWGTARLPLGTFLCIGGIVASLWGQPIIAAYLRWAGF